jgi:hypothetical protein
MWTLFQTGEYGVAGMMIAKAGAVSESIDGAMAAFNLWDKRVVWMHSVYEPWSASIGDILMSPNGIAHRVESIGFRVVDRMNGVRLGDPNNVPQSC